MHINNMFFMLAVVLFITACGPKVPPREELREELPSLSNDSGRIYFYLGSYEGYDLNKYGSAGDIYINNTKVGMINKKEHIAVDVSLGQYSISWKPILADMDMKKHQSDALSIEIKPGDVKYLAANTRDFNAWVHFRLPDMSSSHVRWVDYFSIEQSVPNDNKLVAHNYLIGN